MSETEIKEPEVKTLLTKSEIIDLAKEFGNKKGTDAYVRLENAAKRKWEFTDTLKAATAAKVFYQTLDKVSENQKKGIEEPIPEVRITQIARKFLAAAAHFDDSIKNGVLKNDKALVNALPRSMPTLDSTLHKMGVEPSRL